MVSCWLSMCPSFRPSVRPNFWSWTIMRKWKWIFTKLGMCIDTVEICFGIANGQISSIFNRVICLDTSSFVFQTISSVNLNGFSWNLICALILWGSGLGFLMDKFRQFLTELSARDTSVLKSVILAIKHK